MNAAWQEGSLSPRSLPGHTRLCRSCLQCLDELARLVRVVRYLAVREEHVEATVNSLADHTRVRVSIGLNEMLQLDAC